MARRQTDLKALLRRFHLRRHAHRALARIPVIGRRWGKVTKRQWLLQTLPKGSVGAEIGVFRASFSEAILREVQPSLLHLIDPWRSAVDPSLSGVLFDRPQDQMDAIYESVVHKFAEHIASGSVVVHRARSVDAAPDIPDASLDWVYVDGDHSYEGVRDDLQSYLPKVRPGGLVCGDDYVVGGRFDSGVKKAVDEFAARPDVELVVQRSKQFVLRRAQAPT